MATPTTARGPSFTPEEDAALARAWIATSESTTDLKADEFWHAVPARFQVQPEFYRERSSTSIESRWKTLSRVTQKYLGAEKQFRSCTPSGESEEDTLQNVMELYCCQNKYLDKGVRRNPRPIKFMQTVRILSACPKFS